MTHEEVVAAAKALFEAERSRVQTGLLSKSHPDITLGEAYAVQGELVRLKRAAGARPVGWKIGLTSRAMQEALGITTPDSGVLFDDMQFTDAAIVPTGHFIKPRVEAEIAFEMARPLAGSGVTRDEVAHATARVMPCVEILDTRIHRRDPATGDPRRVTDTIADNAANAGFVLGGASHPVNAHDLRRVGVIVRRNGIVEETGLGAGVLDDPLLGVVWLVKRLATIGAGLAAGEIVLSGSFIRPVEVPPGSGIEADFGDFGAVSIAFG